MLRQLVFILAMLSISFAVYGKAKSHMTCMSEKRKIKDCHINYKNTKLHVWNDQLFVNNGVKRSQLTLPIKGEGVEWASVRLRHLARRLLLEIKYWGPVEGEGELQKSHWLVYEIKASEAQFMWSELLQRRKKVIDKETNEVRYEKDKLIPHKLFIKKKKLYRKYGRKQKII